MVDIEKVGGLMWVWVFFARPFMSTDRFLSKNEIHDKKYAQEAASTGNVEKVDYDMVKKSSRRLF